MQQGLAFGLGKNPTYKNSFEPDETVVHQFYRLCKRK